MKTNYLLILFLFLSSLSFAQGVEVGGVVKETGSGLPIPGVNIQVKNGTANTASDIDGRFSLKNVSTGATLVFSYIGYKNLEYKVVSANSSLSIVLIEDSKLLDEVVVIGYGSQKKKEVTGAVSIVDSKTLEVLKPVRIEQALQGTVSGVNVTSQSGSPGAALDIRIRGIATNGDAKPLTIIDGYIGELGLLNPNDVETITVLKDAQAAIYGSAAANGVILVTTKTGKKNSKGKIAYNSYVGFQETSRTLPTLNATEYALLLNESYANSGSAIPYPNVSGLGKGTNWQDQTLSTGVPIISHDLTFSGGSDKITYSVSGSHLDQEGIVGKAKSGFLRNTARVSLGADVTDKLKLKTNVIYTYFDRKTLPENGNASVLLNAVNAPSNIAPYDTAGNFTQFPGGSLGNEMINPLAQIANTYNEFNFKQISGNFGLDYKFTPAFVLSSSIGFKTANSEGKSFSALLDYGSGKVFNTTRSSVSQNAVNDNNYSFDLFATYTKTVAENHKFVGVIGNTIFKEYGNGLFATGFDVPNNSWDFADIALANGAPAVGTIPVGSYVYDERRLSYFGRLQYDYKGKYLLSGMIRRDGSTKFGPGNKFGYFPSVTAGWIISDEGFFGESSVVNFLKLRGSYGIVGNDAIPNNGYISQLTGEATYVFDGTLVNGRASGQIPNPNLKWEEAKKFDIGLDMNLFNNKLTLVADYFIDTRTDLLIPGIPVSGISGGQAPGASNPTINAGTVRNEGIEFSANFSNKFSEDFNMTLGYNVTLLRNEVTQMGTPFIEGGSFGIGQLAPSRMQVGHSIGYFYGLKTDGVFQNQQEVNDAPSQLALGVAASPGDIRFVDVNEDGKIDFDDRTDIGDPIPTATMGFNMQFNYKALDFSMYTFASLGNNMVRNYESIAPDANRLNYVLGRWTGEGTSTSVPRVTTAATSNKLFSDYFVEDASYVRIQNIQLGYTLNPRYIEKMGISKVRLYAGVNNLYTFTKYKGFDPGASNGAPIGGGIDYGFYPIPRTYMLGLNINF
ncbi:TonB-dependent receptor [Flavobacterium sp. F-380]|uniref:TonB-dependent receptor n=1 Tax=Flavobacterium kayseriense TaxID=2764714 RepID=A0ABR7J6T3_9FLAO|nr:TonB-dependent receptor [Flavobacterium kayseriense]MBC5841044.1 TonB-dependent receptor [Flavobacterium kayseriense]MBC5847572.1 TonB-dependent receptor [Flavobacterium kayseriense]